MRTFCVTKDGRAWEGTKADILSQICTMRFVGKERRLHYKFMFYIEVVAHDYGDEFSVFEAASDAVNHIWGKLPEYGFRIYQSI
jgi:hypothetical protein